MDVLSVSVLGIFTLLIVIALILYLKFPETSRNVQGTMPPIEKDILSEVKKLRQDFETRFGTKFSKQGFYADDAYPFFLAFSNSLNRFDREKEAGLGSNVLTEAKGYVAMSQLILSWAQANGEDGVKRKAEEFLEAAQRTLERARHL